jgi:hypothetical protein
VFIYVYYDLYFDIACVSHVTDNGIANNRDFIHAVTNTQYVNQDQLAVIIILILILHTHYYNYMIYSFHANNLNVIWCTGRLITELYVVDCGSQMEEEHVKITST